MLINVDEEKYTMQWDEETHSAHLWLGDGKEILLATVNVNGVVTRCRNGRCKPSRDCLAVLQTFWMKNDKYSRPGFSVWPNGGQ